MYFSCSKSNQPIIFLNQLQANRKDLCSLATLLAHIYAHIMHSELHNQTY